MCVNIICNIFGENNKIIGMIPNIKRILVISKAYIKIGSVVELIILIKVIVK